MGIRPQKYEMPDIRGHLLDDAIPLIENHNLILGRITSVFYKDKPLNSIVAQDPLSGYSVTEGSTVDLVVNREPVKKGSRYLQGSQGGNLFRYRLKDGFLKRHIRVVLNSFGVSNPIFDDFMKPGEEIWLIIPKNNSTTVFLYEDGQLIKAKDYGSG
jgi:serine/threonine-protein kinase